MRTRQQGIDRFADVMATVLDSLHDMTPREQAVAAWSPTSKYTVDQLEDLIRIERGMEPIHRDGAA